MRRVFLATLEGIVVGLIGFYFSYFRKGIFMLFFENFVKDKEYSWIQVLVAGDKREAGELAMMVEKNKHWSLKIMEYLDSDSSKVSKKREVKILAVISELSKFLHNCLLDHVVFILPLGLWGHFPIKIRIYF